MTSYLRDTVPFHNINTLNIVGTNIVKEDGLPFIKDKLEEDADFKDINIKTNLEYPN